MIPSDVIQLVIYRVIHKEHKPHFLFMCRSGTDEQDVIMSIKHIILFYRNNIIAP